MHATTLQIAVQFSRMATIEKLLGIQNLRSPKSSESRVPALSVDEISTWPMINARDDMGRTAMHYLVDRDAELGRDSEVIMQKLITHGADIMARSREGVTALHVAAAIGTVKEFKSLTERGLDLNALTQHGASMLHFAAMGLNDTSMLVKILIREGFDMRAQDVDGNSPIHYAAASCNVTAIQILLDENVSEIRSAR